MQKQWLVLTRCATVWTVACCLTACGNLFAPPSPSTSTTQQVVAQPARAEAPPERLARRPFASADAIDVYGSYGDVDEVAVTLSVELAAGPYVAGELIKGACTARNARGVPVAANVNWGIEHKTQAPDTPRRKRTPCAGDHFTVTEHGLIGAKAGTFELLCEQRSEDGVVLSRSAVRTLTIEPAAATHWRVELHDQGPCFDQASRLPMTWDAWDDFGNSVSGLDVTLNTDPPSRVGRDDSGGFLLLDEGAFALTITARGPRGEALPAIQKHVDIDSTPPSIEITSPARGALVHNHDFNVMLVGKVVDRRNAIVSFELEGKDQPLSRDANGQGPLEHHFRIPYAARWGLNVVHAKVSDACGNTRTLLQSFLQSGSFAPLSIDTSRTPTLVGDRLPGAVKATLDERLWDQGDPHSEHDLRHLVEVAMANGGLNERLPQHLESWPHSHVIDAAPGAAATPGRFRTDDFGIDVWRDGPLVMQPPEVESLRIEPDGFAVRMNFRDIELPVAIEGKAALTWWTLRAAVAAEKLTVEASASVRMSEQGPVVDICPSCVKTSFDGGEPVLKIRRDDSATPHWQKLSASLIEWLLRRSTHGLVTGLQQRVRADMMHEMGHMLRGLKLEHALKLPAPLRGRLTIQSGLDDIALRRDASGASCAIDLYSAIEMPLDRQQPKGMKPHNITLTHGPIRAPRQTVDVAALPRDDSTFAISVADDLINQVVWSMWAGGALDADNLRNAQDAARADTDDQGRNLLEAASLKVYFTTPPVIMPSTHPDEVRVGVGDVYAEIEIDLFKMNGLPTPPGYKNLAASGYFSIGMRAKLGVDQDTRSLRIVKLERSHAQVHVLESPSPIALMAVTHWLEKMVRLTMPHHLAQVMTIAVPLPNLQIGSLPGVPPRTTWSLEDVSLMRPPSAQETILRGHFGPLPHVSPEASLPVAP